MKKSLFIFWVLVLLVISARAQQVRLNGYGSFLFNSGVNSFYDNTSYYNGRVEGNFQWGAGIELLKTKELGVEFSYNRLDTKAPITYFNNGIKFTNFDLAVNRYMLGANKYFQKKGSIVEAYGGLMGGISGVRLNNPDNGNTTRRTFVSWGIRGGANFWVSSVVAIKLQAQMISDIQSVGGGFYFGTGGSGAGLSAQSTIYQFGLGGGLVFKLKR